MASRNFVVTVKERDLGKPCFLVFETDDDIGLGKQSVTLDLVEGTDVAEAQRLARTLNDGIARIALMKR